MSDDLKKRLRAGRLFGRAWQLEVADELDRLEKEVEHWKKCYREATEFAGRAR